MNEIDLKLKIEGLEKVIQEHKADANRYEDQLKETQKQLEDYNKPELAPVVMDKIYETIEKVVTDFDFTDTDNFEIDYSLDYDGRVQCESHEFINGGDLAEIICNAVYKLFKEADCPEDDQVNTHTVAEKII